MKDEKLSFIQKTLIKNSDPPNVVKIIRGGRGKIFDINYFSQVVKSLHGNLLNEVNQSVLSPSKSHRYINSCSYGSNQYK